MTSPRTAPPPSDNEQAIGSRLSNVAGKLRKLADSCDDFGVAQDAEAIAVAADAAARQIAPRVRIYLAARRWRETLFGPEWFSDPAWDMLLDLLASHHEGRRITVSSVCIASMVPHSTALRWLDRMVQAGMIEREEDTLDRRRTYLAIAPHLIARLDTWALRALPPPT